MSGPEQNQAAPAAPQECPELMVKRPCNWAEMLLLYGFYAALGAVAAFVLLPNMWSATVERWPTVLAALTLMRGCDWAGCSLNALGYAIHLMTLPIYCLGLALWWLLYKRHLRVASVICALCLPLYAHVFMPGSLGYRLGFFLVCFALSTYLTMTSQMADAGVFILMGVSAGLMVVRYFLDRKGGA